MAAYAGEEGNQGGSPLGRNPLVGQLLTHHPGNVGPSPHADYLDQVGRFGEGQASIDQGDLPVGSQGMDGLGKGEVDEAVSRTVCGLCSDLHGLRLAYVADRHDCFKAHARMLVRSALLQTGQGVIQAVMPATGHPCGIGAGQVVLCLEKAVKQGTVHHLMRFVHPDGLEELALEIRIIGLQSIDPFLNCGDGLGFRQVHQAKFGQLTGAAYGIGQLPAQLVGAHLG